MKYLTLMIFIFYLTSFAKANQTSCPICKGDLVDITKQKDDKTKPSRNLSVWNRSNCGNPFYGKGSLICLKDNYAYDAKHIKKWTLSITNKDNFALSLHKSIYDFPLPIQKNIKSRTVYSQEFKTINSVKHSLLFWCIADKHYLKKIKSYANKNGITLVIEKNKRLKQSIIKANFSQKK